MPDTKMKPCPFCGGGAYYHEPTQSNPYDKVNCKVCNAFINGPYAITAWNTRATPTVKPLSITDFLQELNAIGANIEWCNDSNSFIVPPCQNNPAMK